jgi:hypothetical protein
MIKVMTVVLIASAAPLAHAHDPIHAQQVETWYQRYLGRAAEPFGLYGHTEAMCQGTPAIVVEATILASPEYFDRNGCNDPAFVAALYRDVLGAQAAPQQLHQDVHHLQRMGNREAFTLEFLQTRRALYQAPVAPVVQTYRPVYVAPAPVVRPVVVPAPVYRPAYAYPRPYGPYGTGVTVGVRQPNFGFGITIR